MDLLAARALRPLAALAVLVTGLVGCTPPADQSSVVDYLRAVSFDVPPAERPVADDRVSGQTGAAVGRRQPGGVAQVFEGTSTARPVSATGAHRVRRGADGVEVNFDRAEIREVARVLLGDILGLPYTVDPRVQGEVTLSSAGPLPEDDLLPLLETVLRPANAALLRSGATYAIVPLDELRGPGEVIPLGGTAMRASPGFGITIVPLRYISAQNAAALIQPLVERADDIRVDPTRNLLLFSGVSSERQNVVETLTDLDVDWLANRAVGIFPLTYSTPEAMIPELEALFAPPDVTGGSANLVRFLPIARLSGVLAIAANRAQINDIQEWIRRLDRGESVGMQFYVYYLRHAPADDVARVLNEIFGTGDGASGGTGPGTGTSPFGNALATAPTDNGDLEPPVLGEGAVQPIDSTFGGTGSGGDPNTIKIVANRTNNSLLIRATPQVYESIEGTLRRLDTPPLQVLIEATIAEITLNDLLRYGVQYFLQFGSVRFGYNSAGDGSRVGPTGLLPLGRLPGFNFIATPGDSNITIDALSQITNVKVLSSPSVVVQDNSAAVLTVGDEVPVITGRSQAVTDPDAPIVQNVEYRNTGVILEVKPRVNNNQSVALDIAQEVSRVAPSASGADSLTPTFTQRKITSRVNVRSGQTVALGGLIQDAEESGRDSIPILGDIPIIGNLFGSTSTRTQRTELIVFITPRVIRDSEDARTISEELRSRLRAIRPAQSLSDYEEPFTAREPAQTPARQPIPEPEPRPLVPPAMTGGPFVPARDEIDLALRIPPPQPRPRPDPLALVPSRRPDLQLAAL
jgi:general secretion pathway protein D